MKKALLLIGSPKPSRSTSESLAGHFGDQLKAKNWEVVSLNINATLRAEGGAEKLLTAVDGADTLVLAFPLYVDSLPAGATKALELIAAHREASPVKQGLIAIVNNGFPDVHQNQPALEICRLFARQAGIEWLGGLALGGGGSISGQPLAKMRGMLRNVIKALNLAAESVAAGGKVPEEAIALLAKPIMPRWLYLLGGDFGWNQEARKNKVTKRLGDRPYVGE